MRCQTVIDLAADDAGPDAHGGGVRPDFTGGEGFTDEDQDTVGHRLPRKAGTGGAEGQMNTLLRGYRQNVRHVVFALHDDHNLRDQPVEAGIGAPGQQSQFVGNDARCGEMRAQGRNE
jgi:hypothetical protein